MRNKFADSCYRCGENVKMGEGHFERYAGKWRTQHASCAIQYRGCGDPVVGGRDATQLHYARQDAKGTGRRAQKARKFLRDLDAQNGPVRYEDF